MVKLKSSIKEDKFIKNKLLWIEENNRQSDRSKQVYLDYLCLYAHPVEVFKGKDLYNFTRIEIVELMQNQPKIKPRNASNLWSAINSYLEWASTRGLCPLGNPCDSINFADIMETNKEAVKKTYIKLDYFWETIERYNRDFKLSYQYLIILILYRYGVNSKDIPFLKWEDIDYKDMLITIWDKDRKDVKLLLPIDDKFIEAIEKCKIEDEELSATSFRSDVELKYEDNEYIVMPTVKYMSGKKVKESKTLYTNMNTIYTRYNKIFTETNELRMSIKNLNNSRKYDLLFNILDERGRVTVDDVSEVYKQIVGKESHTGEFYLKVDFQDISGIHVMNKSEI